MATAFHIACYSVSHLIVGTFLFYLKQFFGINDIQTTENHIYNESLD